jgi:hypothetical protein
MVMSLQHLAEDDGAAVSTAPAPIGLTLARINQRLHRVLTPRGAHVGNLQYSSGQWKFKAIGYDSEGAILPGWGPLTDRHNTLFAAPEEALLNTTFGAFALSSAA